GGAGCIGGGGGASWRSGARSRSRESKGAAEAPFEHPPRTGCAGGGGARTRDSLRRASSAAPARDAVPHARGRTAARSRLLRRADQRGRDRRREPDEDDHLVATGVPPRVRLLLPVVREPDVSGAVDLDRGVAGGPVA